MAENGDRMRILLVEDDRVIAGAVREQAESEGHSVDRAARLDEAGRQGLTPGTVKPCPPPPSG